MDICFLTCTCLWQISQIQTFLFRVVGPGLVSTSPAFVNNRASLPAGPHGWHAKKTVNRAPIAGGRGGSTQFAQQLQSAVTAPPFVGCVVWSHGTHHLFNCTHICTTLSPLDLLTDPTGVTALLARWTGKLAGGLQAGRLDSLSSKDYGSG